MKKKSRIFRIAGLLLVLCFISTVMLSGTFAKYTSTYAGQDTALVAKWSLDVTDGKDNEFALSPAAAADLDLFSHAYVEHINPYFEDGEVKKYIIAPGVGGEFTLSVTNNSDVAAGVTFEFDLGTDSEDVPMEYSANGVVDDSGESIWYTDLGAFAAALNALEENDNGTFALLGVEDADDSTATQTVYWRWPFERGDDDDDSVLTTNDAADTELGKDSFDAAAENNGTGSRTSYILKITATATQLLPGLQQ